MWMNRKMERVKDFKYLGSIYYEDGGMISVVLEYLKVSKRLELSGKLLEVRT